MFRGSAAGGLAMTRWWRRGEIIGAGAGRWDHWSQNQRRRLCNRLFISTGYSQSASLPLILSPGLLTRVSRSGGYTLHAPPSRTSSRWQCCYPDVCREKQGGIVMTVCKQLGACVSLIPGCEIFLSTFLFLGLAWKTDGRTGKVESSPGMSKILNLWFSVWTVNFYLSLCLTASIASNNLKTQKQKIKVENH